MLEWLLSALDAAWLFALHLAGKSSFPGPLSPEEEQACIEQMGRGEPQAKEKLIVHNLRLVAHIAKRMLPPGQMGTTWCPSAPSA